MRVLCAVVAFACLLCAGSVSAATIQAASCSQAHVQTAIATAVDGDTVSIPAGTCTWPGPVGFENKDIAILGAGAGQTILSGEGNFIFYIGISQANKGAFRLSGMTFQGPVTGAAVMITSSALAAVPVGRWRIDHIHFNFSVTMPSGVHTSGVNYGVVDHSTFHGGGVAIRQANGLSRECWESSFPLNGDFQNSQPLDLGTDKFLVVEDSQFLSSNTPAIAYDASAGGGRVVFRRNTVTGGFFYNHWTRGCEVAAQVMEIYQNAFIGNAHYGAAVGAGYPIRWEAGTGVIWGNTMQGFRIGPNAPYVILNDRRASRSESSGWLGACDGSKSHDGNAGDPAAPGWPCLGQIGRAPGKTLEQIKAGDKPVSAPVYLWNNGEEATCATGGICNDVVKVWGDPSAYVKNTPHPNGEIDFSDNNTPKPGYVPFVYPHPLVSGSPAPNPNPLPPPPPPPPPLETCGPDGLGNGQDEDQDGETDEICLPPPSDVTGPFISSFTVGRRTGNNYPVTVNTSDPSGIDHVEFWVGNQMQVRLQVPTSGLTMYAARVQIKNPGVYVVTVKSVDIHRNASTYAVVVTR
jgi:hypothetical protein